VSPSLWRAMLDRSVDESLDGPPRIGFQVDTGVKSFFCGISLDALLDLAGYHGLRGAEEDLFRALWPSIERLISEKHCKGGGADGDLLITCADILRYGFRGLREG
jgi:hypothetical protein